MHHGGAGTTAAGIAVGRPTVIVPFFGDQPFWGAMIARAGAGPVPIPHKKLTADILADAIRFCLKPHILKRAQELAGTIAAERGCEKGAQSFHRFLEPDRLRCEIVPSRAAVWRLKGRKGIETRLSAFAACALANADLLDFQELKLFRAQEHYVDPGPSGPISGGFTAFVGAVGGMAQGLADIPSETWRALQMPAERRRRQSQAPTLMAASEQETSSIDKTSTSSRPLGQHEVGTSKEPDMLGPTGVHMSRGAGQFVKAVVQGPVDISVNLTRGVHNMPKLWGDDTVRPQQRVNDIKTGAKAMGKEFGYG